MSAPPAIERRPLLATLLAHWRTTKVDEDNASADQPLEFVVIPAAG
jgi:hypothetical protein